MRFAWVLLGCVRLLLGASGNALAQSPSAVPPDASPDSSGPVEVSGSATHPAPQPGQVWRDPKTGVEFVYIPGGRFDRGSITFANEKPVRQVQIAAFWLARTEVTQAQWRSVMGYNPGKRNFCDECPASQVSWLEVQKYLEQTNYRLPTEAEWEYAAGGGAVHQRWAGTNHETELGEFAWYRGNSGNTPHPVGRKRPNLFGLFDMSGNVYEWCADWYDADYYRGAPGENPPGPTSGTRRVARGGSWILDPRIDGVTSRLKCLPTRRRDYLGFRPALPDGPGPP